MNRDQKAAVIEEVAAQINDAQAVFAVDYRGLSVTQAVELRTRLGQAGATFRVVKNTLTERAADRAGAESLKELLEGPTAFAFVHGDAALAAKALSNFRRETELLAFKGGTMEGDVLTVEQIESIARLPSREALHGQFVGVLASPLTGLVRGLASMISGLAIQLRQIEEKGLIGNGAGADEGAPEESPAQEPADEGAPAEEVPADDGGPGTAGTDPETAEPAPAAEAPGDAVAEAETAETEEQQGAATGGEPTEAPDEGDDDDKGSKEG